MALHYYPNQRASLEAAIQVLDLLPHDSRWAVEVTEADTWSEPSVLNIFATSTEQAMAIIKKLNLDEIVEQGDHFTSYRIGPLMVSIIEPEEK